MAHSDVRRVFLKLLCWYVVWPLSHVSEVWTIVTQNSSQRDEERLHNTIIITWPNVIRFEGWRTGQTCWLIKDRQQSLLEKPIESIQNIFSVGQEPRESMKQETLWMKSMEFTNNWTEIFFYHELVDVRLSKNNFRIHQEKTNKWRECKIQIIDTIEVSQSKKRTIKKAIENNYPRGGKRHEPLGSLEEIDFVN